MLFSDFFVVFNVSFSVFNSVFLGFSGLFFLDFSVWVKFEQSAVVSEWVFLLDGV